MTLIVEDGTVVSGAESYISVVDADTYHNNFGNKAWTNLTDVSQKEALLRSGTRLLTLKYRPRWNGWRTTTTQLLDWPRIGAYIYDVAAYPVSGHLDAFVYMVPTNSIPQQLKDAVCEAALIMLTDQPLGPLEQGLESFQSGSVRIQFDKFSPQQTRYPILASILQPLLKSTGAQIRVAR
jgi:hypothetical protein